MIVGSYGPIPFVVSSLGTLTFRDLERERRDSWAEHEVLDGVPCLQRTGLGLETLSFSVRLAADMLRDPATELQLLRKLMDLGRPWPLLLSYRVIGRYVLTGVKERWTRFSGAGRLLVADVDCSFREYR